MEYIIYNKILKSHCILDQDDIKYSVPILISRYGLNSKLLVHLFKDYYIGKLSISFNNSLDNTIKKRKLELTENMWPELETGLTQDELNTLHRLENIEILTMDNTIEYIKTFKNRMFDTPNFNILFQKFLEDQCQRSSVEVSNFDITIKIGDSEEVGSVLKITHYEYVDICDILKSDKLSNTMKYKKEIQIIKNSDLKKQK